MLVRRTPLTFAAVCAWMAAVAATGGCLPGARNARSASGTPAVIAPVGAAVRVRFSPPADVRATRGRADTVTMRSASMLLGRVRAAWDDTLEVAVSEALTTGGNVLRPAGAVATIVPGEGVRVEILSRRPDHFEVAVLMLPIILVVGALLWVCLALCGEAT